MTQQLGKGGNMKQLLLATAALVLVWVPGQAKADAYDPVQLTCSTCSGTNGSFVPLNGGIVSGLQVFSAPPQSDPFDLQLKILVPTNYGSAFNFTASGTS